MRDVTLEQHIPVFVTEVLTGLQCQQPGLFLDCTVGCGGHSAAILAQHPANRVIGLDQDPAALAVAQQRLAADRARVQLLHTRFEDFAPRLFGLDAALRFDGILFDLGVSSLQFDTAARGFSFQHAARLDMRMDSQNSQIKTAYDIVNTYTAEELADVFWQYGEERQSRRIAREIISARAARPIETTTELADLVFRAIPRRFHPPQIHPATRIFQALRIEVNQELQRLSKTLERMVGFLRPGGRIGVIAFHSLEDRIVKQTFVKLAQACHCPPDFPVCVCGGQASLQIITRKPLIASPDEQAANPRARSAKLRLGAKLSVSEKQGE